MDKKALKILSVFFCIVILTMALASCKDTGNISKGDADALISALDEMNSTENRYIIVSFPGLGFEPTVIDRGLGSALTWSGVITVISLVIAIIYAYFTVSKGGVSVSSFSDIAIFGLIGGIVVGRIYYLLAKFDIYRSRPFIDIFKFWDGGMSVFGAMIGCAVAVAIVCKIKGLSVMKTYDALVPPFLIGQVIGCFAAFANGSSYGLPVDEGSLFYSLRMGIYPNIISESAFSYVHPLFLYESVWDLIGLVLISIAFFRKKNFDGQIFFMYLVWYGAGQTFIEMLKADSLYIGSVRITLILAALSFFAGVALLIYGVIEGKKRRLAGEEYESAYPLFKTKFTSSGENNNLKNKTEENKK